MDKITVENVNHPGRTERVNAAKYRAVRDAMKAVLEKADVPVDHATLKQTVVPLLAQELFPGGATAGWWIKTVQLDLEAKGLMGRIAASRCGSI